MRPTRYAELGYEKQGKQWRLIDTSTGAAIGPAYATKLELLADLTRYAEQFGCETAR